jgi:hypothetical protein
MAAALYIHSGCTLVLCSVGTIVPTLDKDFACHTVEHASECEQMGASWKHGCILENVRDRVLIKGDGAEDVLGAGRRVLG